MLVYRMSSTYAWWPEVVSPKEIDPYIDKLFLRAGDSQWVHPLREAIREQMVQQLATPSALSSTADKLSDPAGKGLK